jgi:hypothetical protein
MKGCILIILALVVAGCDSEKQRASDRALAQGLAGTWDCSMTNTHGVRFIGDVTYHTNGLAHWRGTLTEAKGSPEAFDDWGVWRVQHGCLVTLVTNSIVRSVEDEPEYRDLVLSVSPTQFTYRDHLGGVYTSSRKQ